MSNCKLLMPLSMVLTLVACAANKSEHTLSNVEDVKVTQGPKNMIEVSTENDFQPTPNSSTDLATKSELSREPEKATDPSLNVREPKDRLALDLGAASLKKLNEPNQKASSFSSAKDIILGHDPVKKLCEELGRKLGSVSIKDCLNQNLSHSGLTVKKRSLAFKDYPPKKSSDSLGRVLVIGGIHGDEYSSVSVIFKWMEILDEERLGLFHWRFIPSANPDGLLSVKSQRQNHNGVDLNRNFPTADWLERAQLHWKKKSHRNPRRNPGPSQASELETRWLVKQIQDFEPDAIISLHAPYHLIDYDGPPTAPEVLGGLTLRRLGVYPGSLGNYAGVDLKMPIVTVELKSAGIMPPNPEIEHMWKDLLRWLKSQLSTMP